MSLPERSIDDFVPVAPKVAFAETWSCFSATVPSGSAELLAEL